MEISIYLLGRQSHSLIQFWMPYLLIPNRVIQRLDKIRRDFLWKGTEENDSTVKHLVKWSKVLWGKKHGGLGVRNLEKQSKALRLKWLWRYSQEPQPYWGKVIQAKYGEENKWMIKKVLTPYGVSLWKSFRILWPLFKINTTIRVGNGIKTSFWEDKWLGNFS